MSHPAESHPTKEVLFAFAEGLDTDGDIQAIEEHVSTCSVCAKHLEDFNAHSGLVQDLRSAFIRADASTDHGGETIPGRANTAALGAIKAFLQSSARTGSMGCLGHYDILELAGQGTFGIVFKAFDNVLERVVALKVLTPDHATPSEARQRFLREAKSAAAIRHDNVVQIHSVHDQPLPYLVMEYIPGETLQHRLDRSGPFSPAEVVRIGRQIAAGLAAAHARGLIHRDIKLSNILIDPGEEERIKITDFGLARLADDASVSHSGIIAGTPLYMSPEQVRGEELDPRSDLFSMGTALYTMLSGSLPFRGTNTLSVIKSVSEDLPRPLREIVPETPAELAAVISRLHAKQPDARFQTARDVGEALTRCLLSSDSTSGLSGPNGTENGLATTTMSALDGIGSDYVQPLRPAGTDTSTEIIRRPVSRSRRLQAGVAVLGLVLILAIIIVQTSKSEFIIETESPDIAARLDENKGVVVEDVKTGRTIQLTRGRNRLPNGDYELQIKSPDGLEFAAPQITIKRFGTALATIRTRRRSTPAAGTDAPRGNYALQFFSSASSVEIPSLRRDDTGPFTVEMTLKLDPRLDLSHVLGVIFSLEGRAAYQLQREDGDKVKAVERTTEEAIFLKAGFTPQVWHHVACVLDEREHRIYVDGQEMDRMPRIPVEHVSPIVTDNSSVTMLGSQSYEGDRHWHGIEGYIDEVRISKSARYTRNFVPAARLASDKDTIALYHCDEGHDKTLHDASGNGHHGTLIGAKWIPVGDQATTVPPRTVDAQRELAQFLVTHDAMFDCTLTSTGQELKEVRTTEQIPAEPFEIFAVSLHRATDADVKATVDLAQGRVPFRIIYVSNLIGTKRVTAACLKELARLPDLDVVSLDRLPSLQAEDLDALARLPKMWLLNFGNMPQGDTIIQQLHKFPRVSNFLLNHCDVTDDGLLPLQKSRVTRLYLTTPFLTDRAFEILAKMPVLDDLTIIESSGITGATLDKLQRLPIARLYLGHTKLRDESLQFLAGFPKLQTLTLHHNGLTDAALPHLVGLPIKSLDIREPRITKAALQKLHEALPNCQIESNFGRLESTAPAAARRLAEWIIDQGGEFSAVLAGSDQATDLIRTRDAIPTIPFHFYHLRVVGLTAEQAAAMIELAADKVLVERVHLTGPSTTRLLPGNILKQLTRLRGLIDIGVSNTRLNRADIAELQKFPFLTNLGIGDAELPPDALVDLPACKQLRILLLNNCAATDQMLQPLAEMPDLENLYINSPHVTERVWEILSHLPKLNRLDLHHSPAITGEGLALVAERDWDAINIERIGLKEESLRHLTRVKSIRALTLRQNGVTDAGLKYLGGISSLETLNLEEAHVGDAGIAELVTLLKLKTLNVSATHITDAGLEVIARLTSLQELDLSTLPVTDAGLQHLVNMQGLSKINLEQTKVTSQGVQALRASLPACEIIWTPK